MPQATTKTYQLFKETLLNATSDEHRKEILELKFGCSFIIIDNKEKHFIYHISQIHPFWFQTKTDGTNNRYLDFSKENIEIIGRDLTLEDVLMALTLNGGNRWHLITYKRGSMRKVIRVLRDVKQEKFINWIATKPAHLQSEETLLEIIKLLK